jgi:apolipoprotein N-acyltransferase
LKDKTNLIFSILSGLLFAFTWNHYIPALSLFVAFVPLLFLIENKEIPYIKIYNLAFFTFIIFHIGVVWWLAKSSVFGFLVIIISNSMYLALAILLIYRIRQLFGFVAAWFSFVCIWLAFEYMHFWWELSWPFMNLGNWLGQIHKFAQWYEFTGILGGTLWILLINLCIYLILRNLKLRKNLKASIIFTFGLIIIVVPILISNKMYNAYKDNPKTLTFKIIQPNINPYIEKYNHKLFEKQINNQIAMALREDTLKADCYLFPESSFPVYLNEDSCKSNPVLIKLKNELLKSDNALVLGGLYAYRVVNGDSLFYNTAFGFSKNFEIETRHKSKLVIGVEKMPFQDYFKFLKYWNLNFGGFNNSLTIDNEPIDFEFPDKSGFIAPIICYESVYGQYVSDFVKKGATCIAVITNDAWWGYTPGYYQHLMHSKLRAIENRRNVVRAANTGVSCVINGRGDIVGQIPPFTQDILIAKVNLNNQLSFYSRHGDYIGKIAFVFSILILILALYKIIFLKLAKKKL